MRKFIAFVGPLLLALLVFFTFEFFANRASGRGALQVTSTPQSAVYVDGKFLGNTPFCKCDPQNMLPTGAHTIRLVPQGTQGVQNTQFSPFEEKITITRSVLTVVDRTFGKEAYSEGSIITLTALTGTRVPQILVLSSPDNVSISLDGEQVGKTPLVLKNITESDHEIKAEKDGYREKIVRVRTTSGYQLLAKVYLGLSTSALSPTPTSSPAAVLTPTGTQSTVTILQTPTGFLRVRAQPSIDANQVAEVHPGESYHYVDEQPDWYEIKLQDGTTGWVNATYASKQ